MAVTRSSKRVLDTASRGIATEHSNTVPGETKTKSTQKPNVNKPKTVVAAVTKTENKPKAKRQKTAKTNSSPADELMIDKKPNLSPPSTPKKPRKGLNNPGSEYVAHPQDRNKLLPEFAKGLDHVLNIDPSLQQLVDHSTFRAFELEQIEIDKKMSSFEYLVRGIIGQQVSGAAAESIFRKFLSMFHSPQGGRFPTPAEVLDMPFDKMRSAGLSGRKAEYIRGIADAFAKGDLSDDILRNSDDDDAVDMLVALKGVGPWTADMFLLFYQHRMDTFAIGDLGVQRGVSKYIKDRPWLQAELKAVDWSVPLDGLHSPGKSAKAQQRKPAKSSKESGRWKVPESKEMLYIADKFKPYRSVFQMVMWRLSDTALAVLADGEDKKNKKSE